MHIHILGICGTFMGGLAAIARESGLRVTGCDANVYPPMSDQLRALGIDLIEGFDPAQRELRPDLYVIGNVVSRGNPLMEAILDAGDPYVSGPQWLAERVPHGRWVLAVGKQSYCDPGHQQRGHVDHDQAGAGVSPLVHVGGAAKVGRAAAEVLAQGVDVKPHQKGEEAEADDKASSAKPEHAWPRSTGGAARLEGVAPGAQAGKDFDGI